MNSGVSTSDDNHRATSLYRHNWRRKHHFPFNNCVVIFPLLNIDPVDASRGAPVDVVVDVDSLDTSVGLYVEYLPLVGHGERG